VDETVFTPTVSRAAPPRGQRTRSAERSHGLDEGKDTLGSACGAVEARRQRTPWHPTGVDMLWAVAYLLICLVVEGFSTYSK
jgi:hypothetical protein